MKRFDGIHAGRGTCGQRTGDEGNCHQKASYGGERHRVSWLHVIQEARGERVTTLAVSSPTAVPMKASVMPWRTIIASSVCGCAPIASRMPSSRRRMMTVELTTP